MGGRTRSPRLVGGRDLPYVCIQYSFRKSLLQYCYSTIDTKMALAGGLSWSSSPFAALKYRADSNAILECSGIYRIEASNLFVNRRVRLQGDVLLGRLLSRTVALEHIGRSV